MPNTATAKTEAERRLRSTEDNLLRLRDILQELEERVGPLEQQAEKAKKFLAYAGEKKGLEIASGCIPSSIRARCCAS